MMRLARPFAPLLALLALACPAVAQAAAPGLNLGMTKTSTGEIQPSDIDDAHAAGARSVRLFVVWSAIEGAADNVHDASRIDALKRSAARARQHGIVPVLVVFRTPGWANGGAGDNVPPTNNATYADFVGYLASQLSAYDAVYEIWNEQDESDFWATPDPVKYADLLKRAKAAIDAADPEATVLFGALTGNNYPYFEAAYDRGGLTPDSFDGVAVHTDTACLTSGPDFYLRNVGPGLDGRINRFSFLGFREVRASMLARGADKPIWMTELGWSTYTGPCTAPGAQPGRLSGVPPEQQAAFITKAYECLANYPYVAHALVFELHDRGEWAVGRYGILGKPAYAAFEAVPDDGGRAGAVCGDFDPPALTPIIPVTRFTGALPISAKAADPSGVTRITLKVDGNEIRNFTGADVGNDKVVGLEWQGAKQLPPGAHTITIEAIDAPSNLAKVDVTVVKVDPAKLKQTETTRTELRSVKVRKGRRALVVGYVDKAFDLQLRGKVRVAWETRRGRRWKKIHGGMKTAKITPTGKRGMVRFSQKLRFRGRWRVRLTYIGKSPYKGSSSKYVYFRAR